MKKLGSIPILCDNQEALAIAANPSHYEKTKHVDIDCHFVRAQASTGSIQPIYVSSSNHVADLITKVLSIDQHYTFLSKMGV